MDLKVLSIDEMKSLADDFKIKYHPAIGEDKLLEKLERHVEENPGCLGEDEEVKAKPIEPVKTPAKKGKVKIKSQFFGKISSSFGVIDFGEDGIAEVEPEVAEHFCSLPVGYEKC